MQVQGHVSFEMHSSPRMRSTQDRRGVADRRERNAPLLTFSCVAGSLPRLFNTWVGLAEHAIDVVKMEADAVFMRWRPRGGASVFQDFQINGGAVGLFRRSFNTVIPIS